MEPLDPELIVNSKEQQLKKLLNRMQETENIFKDEDLISGLQYGKG